MLNNLNNTVSQAIRNRQIIPYFQPIWTKDKFHYECLARIENFEDISPTVFIKEIKRINKYSTFTKIMIEKSFTYFKDLEICFSINISFGDIQDLETMMFLEKQIIKFNVGHRLTVEIIEEEVDNFEQVIDFIKKMRLLKVKIAIDDFGSGYSNFYNIISLKPDIVKIDGSLIREIQTCTCSMIVVENIVEMCALLEIKTVAEYVSNEEIYFIAQKIGIDFFQGFYIGEPAKIMKGRELSELIVDNNITIIKESKLIKKLGSLI